MPAPDSDRLLNQREAADFLGLSGRTLESRRARSIGPKFIALSRRAVRYRRPDLEAFVAAHSVATTAAITSS